MNTKKLTPAQKAAKTRKENYAKASPKEKAIIDKIRHEAAIKASKNRKSKSTKKGKTVKTKNKTKKFTSKNPIMVKAGNDAKDKKRRYEGLTNPKDKKLYYDVMMVYSEREGYSKPTCFCCKYDDWKFLVPDHIENRSEDHKNYGGAKMAKKLLRDNFPSGIQILCHNCNTGKEIFGGHHCPHFLSKNGKKRLKKVGLPLGKMFRK